jgi:hypothetical protein
MEIWGVNRRGELAPSVVAACDPVPAPVEFIRILTRVGDVLVTPSSQLAGSQGPVSAGQIRPGPRSLELLSPGDVPRAIGCPVPLDGVDTKIVAIPEEVANPVALSAMLQRGGIPHDFVARGSWLAVHLGRCEDPPQGWEWQDELELLLALTMWAPEAGVPVHRTRLSERALRARLVGVLVACGRNFELRWVPSYLPLEARVAPTDVAPQAFTGVVAVQQTMGDAVDLTVHDATAAVVDLAYLRLRQLEA